MSICWKPFNWLIGLTVQHIAAPQRFSAKFERDGEGRLQLKGRLKQDNEAATGSAPSPAPPRTDARRWSSGANAPAAKRRKESSRTI